LAISLAYPGGEEGDILLVQTMSTLLSQRQGVGSHVLKTGNIKTTCPPTPLLFSMDGWLGEPTDTLHWRFSTVLCLFDLEIRLAAPPSTIFLFHFSVALKWMERKKGDSFPVFPLFQSFFSWFGLVLLHNCGKIIDAFCKNFTYFTYKSSLGRYVFGSEISYNKAPPRLPGLGC
jgi:hypothetical protein